MSFSKLSLFAVAATLTIGGVSAHADSLTIGNSSAGGQMTVTIGGNQVTGYGGNFVGSTGVINGKPVSFSELFCIDLLHDINFGQTYTATDDTSGKIDGSNNPVNNDAEIAWLILNLAPTAPSQAADEAVQVAIWEEEYGNSFKLDSADAGVGSAASADVALANSHVNSGNSASLVSSVEWISPTSGSGRDQYDNQAQVGLVDPPPAVPEPATLSLLGTGILGLAGMIRRRLSA